MKNGELVMLLAPVLTPHGVLTLRPSGDGAALEPEGAPSHAYLFFGPGGAGKRAAARAVAAEMDVREEASRRHECAACNQEEDDDDE